MSSNISTSKNIDQLFISKRSFESSPLKISARELITMLGDGAAASTTVLRSSENNKSDKDGATPPTVGAAMAPLTPKSTKGLRVAARRTLFPTSVVMNAHKSSALPLNSDVQASPKTSDAQKRSASVAASLCALPSPSSPHVVNREAETATTPAPIGQGRVPSSRVWQNVSIAPIPNFTPTSSIIAQSKRRVASAKAAEKHSISASSLNTPQKARDFSITPPASTLPIFGAFGLQGATSKSASNSPAVLGKKVSIQELFNNAASTSGGTQSSSSSNFQGKSHSEVFGGTNFAAQPQSPTKAGPSFSVSPMSGVVTNVFATPTNRQHLRRQQSASATLVGGRYFNSGGSFRASVSAFRRFTPPPGKEISSPIYAASKFSESPSAKSLPMPPEDWIQEAVSAAKFNSASIAEDVEESDFGGETTRPSFFLSNIGSGESTVGEEGDASSTASSGVVFDLEEEEEDKIFPITNVVGKMKKSSKAEIVDSGEGSLSSASDNEFVASEGESTAPSPATPSMKKSGVRMNPFSLIAAVSSSPQIVSA